MFKLCKTEESARRQREIEASLFELMHTKHYDDISITELCLRLNMPRKAFYRYFDSKDDAIRAFLLHTLSEYRGFDMSEKEMKNRSLRRELEMYFSFWQDHRDILITFERSGMLELVTELSVSFPIGERVSTARFLPDDSEHTRDMVFRFAFAGLGAFAGLFGVTVGFLGLLIHLAGLTSLDVPYLMPFAAGNAEMLLRKPAGREET